MSARRRRDRPPRAAQREWPDALAYPLTLFASPPRITLGANLIGSADGCPAAPFPLLADRIPSQPPVPHLRDVWPLLLHTTFLKSPMTKNHRTPRHLPDRSPLEEEWLRSATAGLLTSSSTAATQQPPATTKPRLRDESRGASTTLLCLIFDRTLPLAVVATPSGDERIVAPFSAIEWDAAHRIAEESKAALCSAFELSRDDMIIEQVLTKSNEGTACTVLRCKAALTPDLLAILRAAATRFVMQLSAEAPAADPDGLVLEPALEAVIAECAEAAIERFGGLSIRGTLLVANSEAEPPHASISGKLREKPSLPDCSERMTMVGHFDGYRISSRRAYFVQRSSGSILEFDFDEDRLFQFIYAASAAGASGCEVQVDRITQRGQRRLVLVAARSLNDDLFAAAAAP